MGSNLYSWQIVWLTVKNKDLDRVKSPLDNLVLKITKLYSKKYPHTADIMPFWQDKRNNAIISVSCNLV